MYVAYSDALFRMRDTDRQTHEEVLRRSSDPHELVASAHALCQPFGGNGLEDLDSPNDLGHLAEDHARLLTQRLEECFDPDAQGLPESLPAPLAQDEDWGEGVNNMWVRNLSYGIMKIGERTIFLYGGITEEKMLVLAANLRLLDQAYTQELYSFFEATYKEEEEKQERNNLMQDKKIMQKTGTDDSTSPPISLLSIFRTKPRDPRLRGPLHLHITSSGGAVFPTMGVMDVMDAMSLPIVTHCVGKCFSAGAVLLMGGDRRVMGPHSFVLFHEPRFGAMGQSSDIEQRARNINLAEDEMIRMVARRTYMVDKWGDINELLQKMDIGNESNKIAELKKIFNITSTGKRLEEQSFQALIASLEYDVSEKAYDEALAQYNTQVTLQMQLLSRIMDLQEQIEDLDDASANTQKMIDQLEAAKKAIIDELNTAHAGDGGRAVLLSRKLQIEAEKSALESIQEGNNKKREQLVQRQQRRAEELKQSTEMEPENQLTAQEFVSMVKGHKQTEITVDPREGGFAELDEKLKAAGLENLLSGASEELAIFIVLAKMDAWSISKAYKKYKDTKIALNSAKLIWQDAQKKNTEWWERLSKIEKTSIVTLAMEKLQMFTSPKTTQFDCVEKLLKWYEAWAHAGYEMTDDISNLRDQLKHDYISSLVSGHKHEWLADVADNSYAIRGKEVNAYKATVQKHLQILFHTDIFLPAAQCKSLGIITEVQDHSEMYPTRVARGADAARVRDTSESQALLIRRKNMLRKFQVKESDFEVD